MNDLDTIKKRIIDQLVAAREATFKSAIKILLDKDEKKELEKILPNLELLEKFFDQHYIVMNMVNDHYEITRGNKKVAFKFVEQEDENSITIQVLEWRPNTPDSYKYISLKKAITK